MSTKFKTAIASIVVLLLSIGFTHGEELRLSHQWSTKDVRHQVAQIVADEVATANVDLNIKIFPSKSLFKPREQYKPLSRGQLDMTVFPLSYAGREQPLFNLTLMPGLVKNHDHAARLSASPFMEHFRKKWLKTMLSFSCMDTSQVDLSKRQMYHATRRCCRPPNQSRR